jgi:CRISPR/Cas system type I-B associated protein Csh2 (Cas7 group RAMP superfamily)
MAFSVFRVHVLLPTAKTFAGSLERLDLASVSVTRAFNTVHGVDKTMHSSGIVSPCGNIRYFRGGSTD